MCQYFPTLNQTVNAAVETCWKKQIFGKKDYRIVWLECIKRRKYKSKTNYMHVESGITAIILQSSNLLFTCYYLEPPKYIVITDSSNSLHPNIKPSFRKVEWAVTVLVVVCFNLWCVSKLYTLCSFQFLCFEGQLNVFAAIKCVTRNELQKYNGYFSH